MDTTTSTLLGILITAGIALALFVLREAFAKNDQIKTLVKRVDDLEKQALANPTLIAQAGTVVHSLPTELVQALADGTRLASAVLLAAQPPVNLPPPEVPPSITPQA